MFVNKMDTKTALLIGRFQPLHSGHIKVIEEIAKDFNEIIIGIGSSQESHTQKNPFTAGERLTMLKNSLDSLKNRNNNFKNFNYLIIPIPDVNNNSIWVSHVISLTPEFDVVYTRNKLVTRLFKEAGFVVRRQGLYDRGRHEGTEIRRKIFEGEGWEELVPGEAAEVIRKIGGVERIRELS